ncbi:MAG TPA: hypothetical protein VF932_06310 [Anaerolineae bacterium]
MKLVRLAALLVAAISLFGLAQTASADAPRNSGFYDHQIIEYVNAQETASSAQAAMQISHGLIVYHVVDSSGNTPAVQCARLLAALPNDATSCNTLNFIPSEVGYTGGSWNLQIFHWKAGVTPFELSKDDDITGAAAAGLGTIEVTPILVRCPVVNFANLR